MSKLEGEAQSLWKHYEPLQKQLYELEVQYDTKLKTWAFRAAGESRK